MVGKDLPFAKPHRHYSHLFAIFPLYDMNIDNEPARIPLMKKSIQHYTDLDGDNCIYKFSGASSLWAALGDGDQALKWLNRSLELLPRFGVPPAPQGSPRLPKTRSIASGKTQLLSLQFQPHVACSICSFRTGVERFAFFRQCHGLERCELSQPSDTGGLSGQRGPKKWKKHFCTD